jgi:hypothetical protein
MTGFCGAGEQSKSRRYIFWNTREVGGGDVYTNRGGKDYGNEPTRADCWDLSDRVSSSTKARKAFSTPAKSLVLYRHIL